MAGASWLCEVSIMTLPSELLTKSSLTLGLLNKSAHIKPTLSYPSILGAHYNKITGGLNTNYYLHFC